MCVLYPLTFSLRLLYLHYCTMSICCMMTMDIKFITSPPPGIFPHRRKQQNRLRIYLPQPSHSTGRCLAFLSFFIGSYFYYFFNPYTVSSLIAATITSSLIFLEASTQIPLITKSTRTIYTISAHTGKAHRNSFFIHAY